MDTTANLDDRDGRNTPDPRHRRRALAAVLSPEDSEVAALHRCVHAWADAIVSNDTESMARYVTDDWVLVTPEAGVIERAVFEQAVASGRLVHHTMGHDIIRTVIYDTVAVVTTRGHNTATFEGRPVVADEWTTDVYRRDGDTWRCALTHLTPVAPNGAPDA